LQLFCTRAGAHVLTLPARAMKGVAGAVARFAPDAIVVTARPGRLGRRSAGSGSHGPRGGAPVALYLRDGAPASTIEGARRLDPSPLAAQQELLRMARAAPTVRAG
jgi:hypothetical protein